MSFPVTEKASAVYTGKLVDQTGAAVSGSVLNTLTLTLYDKLTGTSINGRNAQNVLNQNDVTVDDSGVITWTLQPADNAIVNTTLPSSYSTDSDGHYLEKHVALFQATWGSSGACNHEIVIYVVALDKVS